jgi:hypothetical protein
MMTFAYENRAERHVKNRIIQFSYKHVFRTEVHVVSTHHIFFTRTAIGNAHSLEHIAISAIKHIKPRPLEPVTRRLTIKPEATLRAIEKRSWRPMMRDETKRALSVPTLALLLLGCTEDTALLTEFWQPFRGDAHATHRDVGETAENSHNSLGAGGASPRDELSAAGASGSASVANVHTDDGCNTEADAGAPSVTPEPFDCAADDSEPACNICNTMAQLTGCQPQTDCPESLHHVFGVGCDEEYTRYLGCFAHEPVASFACTVEPSMPIFRTADPVATMFGLSAYAHGCAHEECKLYRCLGVPAHCN